MKKEDILLHYENNKSEIKNRLKQFKKLRNSSDERIFQELAFVIFTSQSSAEYSWSAAENIGENNLLKLDKTELADLLAQEEIMYEEQKAKYIVQNREFLSQPTFKDPSTELKLKSRIRPNDINASRKWLVKNIKGISWKGSSHFLRNIGYGDEFAILSKHTVSVLFDLDVLKISEPPKSEKNYLKAEKRVQTFSKEINISIQALDLALWSYKTGKVFK